MATTFVTILSRSQLGYVMFSFLFCGIFRGTKRVSSTVPVSVHVVGSPRRQRRRECVLGSVLETPLKQSIWWYTVVKTLVYLCIPHYKIRYLHLKYSLFYWVLRHAELTVSFGNFLLQDVFNLQQEFCFYLNIALTKLGPCLFSCQPAVKSNLGSLLWFHLSLSCQRGFLCQYTAKLC